MSLKQKKLCNSIMLAFSIGLMPVIAFAQSNQGETAVINSLVRDPSKENLPNFTKFKNVSSVNSNDSAYTLLTKNAENYYFLQEKFQPYLESAKKEYPNSDIVELSNFSIIASTSVGSESLVLLEFPSPKNKNQKNYGFIIVKEKVEPLQKNNSNIKGNELLELRIKNLSYSGVKFIKLIDRNLAYKLKTKKEINSISENIFAWKNFAKFLPEIKVKGVSSGVADVDAEPTYEVEKVVYLKDNLVNDVEIYRQNLLRLKNSKNFKTNYNLKNLASISALSMEDMSKVKLPFGEYLNSVEAMEEGGQIYGILKFVSQEGNNLAALFKIPGRKTPAEQKMSLKEYLDSKNFSKINVNTKYRIIPESAILTANIKDVYDFALIVQANKNEKNNVLVKGDKLYKEQAVPMLINGWNSVLANNQFFNKKYLADVSSNALGVAQGFSISAPKLQDNITSQEELTNGKVNENSYRSVVIGEEKYLIFSPDLVSVKGNFQNSYLILKVSSGSAFSLRSYLEKIEDNSLNLRVISSDVLEQVLSSKDALIFTMVFNVLPTVNRGTGVIKNEDILSNNVNGIRGFELNNIENVELIYSVEIQDSKNMKKGVEFGFLVGKQHFKYVEFGNLADKKFANMKEGKFSFNNVFYAEEVPEDKFKSKIY